MNSNPKSHLWVPDEEVERLDKILTSRAAPRNVAYAEHGLKLSADLQIIKQTIESVAEDNSLDRDLLVFRVELPQGEKVKDKKDLFASNGMQIKAVKNERNAIVTTTASQFQSLKRRVDAYTSKGTGKTHFDYVGDFKPYSGSEKNSSELKKPSTPIRSLNYWMCN